MSDWHIGANQIRTVRIREVQTETKKIITIFFEDELCFSAKPGQFVMVWIPGIDEIPLSLSSTNSKMSSVTVKEVGDATRALNHMKKDDIIGVRGPFGNFFKMAGREALVVGGGIGFAPLIMLTNMLVKRKVNTTVIEGARTRDELLFFNILNKLSVETGLNVVFTTDDGSYGMRGLATEAVEKVLSSKRFDVIFTCGNEVMIRKVYLLARKHKTALQASLERIMRCAMGICGSCIIGRYRVCKDGPVFDETQLKEIKHELGRFKRDTKGERVSI